MAVSKTSPNLVLIAACGINCRVCRAHLRDRNPCPGCRADDAAKPKTRVLCKIKTCEKIVKGEGGFCVGCDEFPCASLARLDKRYKTRYGTSPIDNLLRIEKTGIRDFVISENEKWTCPECGGILCMHEPQCPSCEYVWQK